MVATGNGIAVYCGDCSGRKTRKGIAARRRICIRDDWTCYLCGQPTTGMLYDGDPTPAGHLHASVDHVLPRYMGGTDDAENLRCCHYICNQLKSSVPLPSFLALLTLHAQGQPTALGQVDDDLVQRILVHQQSGETHAQ